MLATSVTTCAAFGACGFSAIWDIRCFGVVAGVMVLADYLLVITFLPAAIITREKYFPARLKSCGRAPKNRTAAVHAVTDAPADAPAPAPALAATATPPRAPDARMVEKFYGGPLADFILNRRRELLVFFACLFVASTCVWTQLLFPASEALDFFDKKHVFTQFLKARKHKFLSDRGEEKWSNWLVAGVDSDDPWKMDKDAHPACVEDERDCAGKANYDSFDLAGHQQDFIDAAEAYGVQLRARGVQPHYETTG